MSSLFALPCVLQCFNSYTYNYQCSILNTYLVTTIFLSEWEYCVYIEIPLRSSPAPTLRALKNMSAVMLHFLLHNCEYRMTWSINPLNIKSNNIMNSTGILSLCVSSMWTNIMNNLTTITRDNYRPFITVIDSCFHARM